MTKIEMVIVALILIILGLLAAPGAVRIHAHRMCMEHGWPETGLAFPLTAYCIKRINQTDSVVRLSDLERSR